jgi:hypothetical protein
VTFYLRVINPIIALLVYILCFWASTAGEDSFNIFGMIIGGMSTYFFAKGIFTSCSIFLIGRILLEILSHKNADIEKKRSRVEYVYMLSFFIFIFGSFITLYFLSDFDIFENKETEITENNPEGIAISNIRRVNEADELKFSMVLKNSTKDTWKNLKVNYILQINDRISDQIEESIGEIKPNEKKVLIADFSGFRNMNVPESAGIETGIEAIRETK